MPHVGRNPPLHLTARHHASLIPLLYRRLLTPSPIQPNNQSHCIFRLLLVCHMVHSAITSLPKNMCHCLLLVAIHTGAWTSQRPCPSRQALNPSLNRSSPPHQLPLPLTSRSSPPNARRQSLPLLTQQLPLGFRVRSLAPSGQGPGLSVRSLSTRGALSTWMCTGRPAARRASVCPLAAATWR